jgi:glycosyltransferase involved in cell wall biosynthesis
MLVQSAMGHRMSSNRALSGKRYLLAAEYVEFGGTRAYFKDLLRFYSNNGADVVAVTSFARKDPDMTLFVESLGFQLIRYSDVIAPLRCEGDDLRPAIWSRNLYNTEVSMFSTLRAQYGLDAVTLSVGTSGIFLSAVSGTPNAIMIAHGYPHGIRQRTLGRMVLTPRIPESLAILAVSDYSGNQFRSNWDASRNRLNIQTIRSTCGPELSPVPLENRKSLVMTAALIENYKNPFDWIAVANEVFRSQSSLESFAFTWLGEGSQRSAAEAMARRTGESSITFPGWSDELRNYYELSRVYLQMSSKESLGLSVVDALRYGLPAVVTDAGGLPEVVLDGVNGFVVPVGDVNAAAAATIELLRNDKLWQKQAEAARELYQERFSATSWNDALLEAHLTSLN